MKREVGRGEVEEKEEGRGGGIRGGRKKKIRGICTEGQ